MEKWVGHVVLPGQQRITWLEAFPDSSQALFPSARNAIRALTAQPLEDTPANLAPAKNMVIDGVCLVEKTGGRSGDYRRGD